MTRFTIDEDLCETVCVGVYYKMVEGPVVENWVSSTMYFNWQCGILGKN